MRQVNAEAAGLLKAAASEDGSVNIHVQGGTIKLDVSSFVALMFDREPDIEAEDGMCRPLRSLFPIPFPYTGGLNYV
ncbi:hypothetical protein SD70_28075 [Gordoniibacillus kamchatkensis]|uniref:Uncharacterized protein n=1 Tax=Gordoniibacillus kamchatkensis TaxID=1590651 RepID=A0ABR5AAU9_9BACL|nr:hypothetical protein SD70_28075 [Paenibacillus sp. VKM B-2647]